VQKLFSFLKYFLEELRELPLHSRRRIAFWFALIMTVALVILWLAMRGTSSTPAPRAIDQKQTPSPRELWDEWKKTSESFRQKKDEALKPFLQIAANKEETVSPDIFPQEDLFATSTEATEQPVVFLNEPLKYSVTPPQSFLGVEMLTPELSAREPRLVSRVVFSRDGLEKDGPFVVSAYRNDERISVTAWVREQRTAFYEQGDLIEDGTVCGFPSKIYTSVDHKKTGIYFLRSMENGLFAYAIEWITYDPDNETALADFEAITNGFSCL
jgi:hypothetical protein